MTTDDTAAGRGVNTGRMGIKEGVEVVVDSEASLKGSIGAKFRLESGDRTLGQALERTSEIGHRPVRSRVASSLVALGGSTSATVVGLATREALLGAGGVSVLDHPVPGLSRRINM
jgi:hypothetical protein